MQRRVLLGTGAAVLVGGGVLLSGLGQKQASGQSQGGNINPSVPEVENIDTSEVVEMILGHDDAPVTLIEYASYTCPHCSTFHVNVMPRLKEKYIDSGKVRLIYREVYFDRFGLWAGMLARCGGPLRYFGIQDVLYRDQDKWIGSGDPKEIIENLREIGKYAGISDHELDACFSDEKMPKAMLAVYQRNAEADGVNATPTFFINGIRQSSHDYNDLTDAIDQLI